jgi:hypothetical protein
LAAGHGKNGYYRTGNSDSARPQIDDARDGLWNSRASSGCCNGDSHEAGQ